jgi:hypothetical protein
LADEAAVGGGTEVAADGASVLAPSKILFPLYFAIIFFAVVAARQGQTALRIAKVPVNDLTAQVDFDARP